jgi:hypothetical protein
LVIDAAIEALVKLMLADNVVDICAKEEEASVNVV